MANESAINKEVWQELDAVVQDLNRLSADAGKQVATILREGREQPLSRDEAYQLLTQVIAVLESSARQRGDKSTSKALKGNIKELVERIITARGHVAYKSTGRSSTPMNLRLLPRNGIEVGSVRPTPWFHGHPVPMLQGFLRTIDIPLWDKNSRLDIHLDQFRQIYRREPNREELLDIMLTKVPLPGIDDLPGMSKEEKADQFKIRELAHSIATNGVQRPPILDTDFSLLDGNRRVAACHYILRSDEFDLEAKQRAEHIFVWQLTEQRTPDDQYNVIIALNFEGSYKVDWPEYVKIRKVYEAWQESMILSSSTSDKTQLEIRHKIAEQFAIELSDVTRYIKMMRLVDEFEDYHINQKSRDTFEVKHRANRYIQYFDELSKGSSPGTVQYELDRDLGFKNLVFDLLFDGKFKNWTQIRELKYIYDDKGGRDALEQARTSNDPEAADGHLKDAMAIARVAKAEKRELGANARIETFATWLEELPPKTFRDSLTLESLERLLKALKLVEPLVKTARESKQKA